MATSLARSRFINAVYLRNAIFGGEDSLVSTVGLLSGVAAGGIGRQDLILTGVVLIMVEALSMAVGSFVSEDTAEEYLKDPSRTSARTARVGAVVMFLSYLGLGIIPLLPYLLFPIASAFWISIVFSIVALGALGLLSGRSTKGNAKRAAMKMVVLGGSAIAVGVLVSRIIK